MTDNDIIKALEYCLDGDFPKSRCNKCYFNKSADCMGNLRKAVLDLINRKEAENKSFVVKQYALKAVIRRYEKDLERAKSEAIKEFWKRFDKVLCENIGPSKRVYWKISSDGDNLVKEMTESPTKIEHSSLCETDTYEVKE